MTGTNGNRNLLDLALEPLELGSVRPKGWLENQLRIQANGLSGHLHEFWGDIADSGWIGGKGEGWERLPYWLDGIVPLAFLINDEPLKKTARWWIDDILARQQEDGWLGPIDPFRPGGGLRSYDPWPVSILLKAMTQYQEATGDPRIIPAMLRCLKRVRQELEGKTFMHWSNVGHSARSCELTITLYWLYDRLGESWLLDFATEIREKREQGFDWQKYFRDFKHTGKITPGEACEGTHVVNAAMGIKQPGINYRQSGDPRDRADVDMIIETLDRFHGQATGIFTGDEHYATKNPSQGTETCAVVEYLYSLELLIAILCDVSLADRLELIAFNALPAPFKPDMWARQYNQQANQVLCAITNPPIWETTSPEAGIYGVESNYGCCTANMHQGWPKFAAHLWMKTPDKGLAAVAYAPCVVRTEIGGVAVEIEVVTDYPFDGQIELRVRATGDVRFPLDLRVPSWANGASVTVDGEAAVDATAGTFHRLERKWVKGETCLKLRLPMRVEVERRFRNSAAITRGPLVYSLRIGEEWRMIRGEAPHGDYEVHPTTPWNYALEIDTEHPEKSLEFTRHAVGDSPFSSEGAPITVKAKGRRMPEWVLDRGAAGLLPESPVRSDEPLEDLTLIPYGCAKLRVTEFPVLG